MQLSIHRRLWVHQARHYRLQSQPMMVREGGGGRGFVYLSVLYRCRGSHRGDSSTPEPRRPSLSGVPAEFPKIKKTPFCASDKSSIVLKFPTAVQLCIMLS